MEAIVLNTNNRMVELKKVSKPSAKQGEVLVKTLFTGVCSTDRELIDTADIITPSGNDYLIIGHEAVGEVVETGSGRSNFKKGDIVVPTVRRGCKKCSFCKEGRSDICSTGFFEERGIAKLHGFMSEYFVEKAEYLIKVPENLKKEAVLLEPLSVGVKAIEESLSIQRCRLNKNFNYKKALIVGTGSIGLLCVLILRNLGVDIVCMDIDNENGVKANIIKSIGARYINIKKYKKNNIVNIKKLCENYNEIKEMDIIIDSSGDTLTCLQILNNLKFNGICVLLSLAQSDIQAFDFNKSMSNIVLRNNIILGSVNSNYSHFVKAIQHLEQAKKTSNGIIENIISHRLHFSDFSRAFNIKSTNRIKVVLTWE